MVGEAGRGPLPPRSAWGLRCQFYLQWLYAPVGFAVLLAPMLLGGGGSGPIGGRPKGVPKDPYGGDGILLTRRQYRLERNGTPEQWRERAGYALQNAIAAHPAHPGEPITLYAATYRGIGPAGLDAVAAPLGWRIDWSRMRYAPAGAAYLVPAAGSR